MRRLLLGLLLVAAAVLVLARPADAALDCSAAGEPCPATTLDEPAQPRVDDDTSPPYVMIALTTILVAGGCLYLLLRRGSIAHRAREDDERPSGA